MTMKVALRLNACAAILGDGKLSAEDVVAHDFMHHSQCLSKLYDSV